jgi:hypothetical protein
VASADSSHRSRLRADRAATTRQISLTVRNLGLRAALEAVREPRADPSALRGQPRDVLKR